MRSKIFYLILSFICIFTFTSKVEALTGTVNVDDALYLRSSASSSGSVITSFYNGTILTILNSNAGTANSCTWYQVSYGGYTGYVCGTYVTLNTNTGNETYSIGNDGYDINNYASPSSKDGFIACYEDTGDVSLRSSAGGDKTGNKVSCGTPVSVLSTVETGGTCKYWSKINDGTNTGYLCSYFVNTTKLSNYASSYYANSTNGDTIASYQSKLSSAGFPSSYWPYLLEIHARHPSWKFEAEALSMTFDAAVNGETTYGGSLLQGSANDQGYFSTAAYSYNVLTDTFTGYSGEPGWYNASKEAVAYYLDPRTYLNEKYIFAFETLEYRNNQTATIVRNYFSGATLFNTPYKYYNSQTKSSGYYSDGSTGDYAIDIVNASSNYNVSAIHISSRIKQEVSSSGSPSSTGGSFSYCGVTYIGYYNFFNIGAYSTTCSNGTTMGAVASGLYYAGSQGWNTPYKSIKYGTSFIASKYIALNQDTLYYEKFDVSTTNGHYNHQYQTNITAPVSEGGSTFNGYVNSLSSYLNTAITFVIPVYKSMPNYAITAPKLGNPNNYLKDLKINGTTVSNFSYNTFNYNKSVSSGSSSITISATPINSGAKITGTGTINLTSNTQTIPIKVTAKNGRTRIYNIIVNQNAQSPTTVTNLMNNSGFKYNDNYLFGISVGANVSSLIGNIRTYNNSATVTIKSSSGIAKTNAIFATGDKISVTGSDATKTYTAIIYGDVNGDGKISAVDYVKIKNHIMKTSALTSFYLEAGDVNKDKTISAVDYVKIKNNIMGTSKIVQ